MERPARQARLTSYHIDAEMAAERGALRPEPSSRQVRQIPETREEIEAARANSPGVSIMRTQKE